MTDAISCARYCCSVLRNSACSFLVWTFDAHGRLRFFSLQSCLLDFDEARTHSGLIVGEWNNEQHCVGCAAADSGRDGAVAAAEAHAAAPVRSDAATQRKGSGGSSGDRRCATDGVAQRILLLPRTDDEHAHLHRTTPRRAPPSPLFPALRRSAPRFVWSSSVCCSSEMSMQIFVKTLTGKE